MDFKSVWSRIRFVGLLFWELILLFGVTIFTYGEKLYRLFVPRTLKSLKGEIILLTGSGKGIGKQLAMELANVGATIVCWVNEGDSNSPTIAELKRRGTKVFGYAVDISERENIVRAAAQVRVDVGDVTIVINNAGIAPNGSFLEMNEAEMEKTFQVNILSHIWILRQFLPRMIEMGRGHVVTIASMASFVPAQKIAAYASSKHAVKGFIDSLREEIREHPNKPDIKFTTVYPIFVATRLLGGITFKSKFDTVPIITPEYVAKTVVEGFRRNYEHLFVPPYSVIFALLACLPERITQQLQTGLLQISFERQPAAITKKSK